ncbi:hypothetical protein H3302_18610 [Pseudoalteromonas sp. MT33b]|uniref:polymorphic toxin type 10 domain-containing protein n=1 Tax=Pseudoalteromonas sp. MT33b TaxID=2759705 RepID=UPI0015FCEC2A|nr:polymorphic toxin type 10 domain-containing protein [Pseudoalteromonas sp. MT33b]QMW16295.1 hypothetical protein H3302_18610 [Pseudoalteromonas sp. MT33b]
MQARYYDPVIGRFYSNDPVGFTGEVDTFNRYSYVGNNPYKYTDPDGKEKSFIESLLSTGNGPGSPARRDAVMMQQFAKTGGDMSKQVAETYAGAALMALPGPEDAAIVAGTAVASKVPAMLARVVPNGIPLNSLGALGSKDVFVTDAKALEGLSSNEIADALTIPQSSIGFSVIEFPSSSVSGIASPIARDNPGFVQGGQTAGGVPEFVIPNGKLQENATIRQVD